MPSTLARRPVRSLPRAVPVALAAAVAALCISRPLAGQTPDATLDRVLRAALGSETVVETYRTFTDVHGPRLSGTPAYREAAAYARNRLDAWGLEAWTAPFEFGRGWTLEKLTLEMTAPRYAPLHGHPEAWSPGTGEVLEGDAVYVGERTADEIRAMGDALRGRIVLPYPPQPAFITEDRLQPTEHDRPVEIGAPSFIRPDGPVSRREVPDLMREMGVGAYFRPDQGQHGTLFVLGTSRDLPDEAPASMVMSGEHYNRIVRLIEAGVPVRLRVDVDARFHEDDPTIPNVLAEIPGTDPAVADEIVMAGAHLDSWHSASGATDNADGSAAVMEAIRILHEVDARPRRTIRVALWGGEEQGLLGSRAWVAEHVRDGGAVVGDDPRAGSHVVFYVNQDIGGGATYGLYLQDNDAWKPLLDRWVARLAPAGARCNVDERIGSSDHISFERAGVPAFSTVQDYVDYDVRTHHTNADDYERNTPEDLRRSAAFLAGLLWQAASYEGALPEGVAEGQRR